MNFMTVLIGLLLAAFGLSLIVLAILSLLAQRRNFNAQQRHWPEDGGGGID